MGLACPQPSEVTAGQLLAQCPGPGECGPGHATSLPPRCLPDPGPEGQGRAEFLRGGQGARNKELEARSSPLGAKLSGPEKDWVGMLPSRSSRGGTSHCPCPTPRSPRGHSHTVCYPQDDKALRGALPGPLTPLALGTHSCY